MLALWLLLFTLDENPVAWSFSAPEAQTVVRAGALFRVKVEADIAEGWHVHGLKTPAGGAVATSLTMTPGAQFEARGAVEAPDGQKGRDAAFGVELESYENMVEFTLPVAVAKDARPGPATLTVVARYQACREKECLPARTARLELKLEVR